MWLKASVASAIVLSSVGNTTKIALEVLFFHTLWPTFKKGSCSTVLSSSSFPQQKIQGFKGILMLASWCCVWALQEGSFGALKSESCMPAWLSAPISCLLVFPRAKRAVSVTDGVIFAGGGENEVSVQPTSSWSCAGECELLHLGC